MPYVVRGPHLITEMTDEKLSTDSGLRKYYIKSHIYNTCHVTHISFSVISHIYLFINLLRCTLYMIFIIRNGFHQ